jgi:hypothetical protein
MNAREARLVPSRRRFRAGAAGKAHPLAIPKRVPFFEAKAAGLR